MHSWDWEYSQSYVKLPSGKLSNKETFKIAKLLAYKHERTSIRTDDQYNNVSSRYVQSTQELIAESDVIVSCITVAATVVSA